MDILTICTLDIAPYPIVVETILLFSPVKISHFHPCMLICKFAPESAFDGLIGYNFIRKYNLLIIPNIECCKISSEYIPFINKTSNFNPATDQCNTIVKNKVNTLPSTNHIDFSQLLHVKPFVPQNPQGVYS